MQTFNGLLKEQIQTIFHGWNKLRLPTQIQSLLIFMKETLNFLIGLIFKIGFPFFPSSDKNYLVPEKTK